MSQPSPLPPKDPNAPAVIDLVKQDLGFYEASSSTGKTVRLVAFDLDARDAQGQRTYGTRLYPGNGRDALMDAYEEALDLMIYLRQDAYEKSRWMTDVYESAIELAVSLRSVLYEERGR